MAPPAIKLKAIHAHMLGTRGGLALAFNDGDSSTQVVLRELAFSIFINSGLSSDMMVEKF